MNFLEKLDFLMARFSLNKRTLSINSDIPYTTIDNWYKRGYEGLKLPTLRKLAEYFNTTLDYWILDEITDPNYGKSSGFKVEYNEMEHIKKYRFISTHSPDGSNVVDTVLDREYAIAEKLKAQEDAKDRTSSSTTPEIIPLRFLSYYQRMASAGRGEYLFSDIPTDVIAVPDTPLSRRADFVIGVNGRSMEDTYFDGDKVLVEKTQDVPVGKIGIFIRGSECFIKEVGEDRLISHNIDKERYPDIIPDERRIDAIGIVLGKVGD